MKASCVTFLVVCFTAVTAAAQSKRIGFGTRGSIDGVGITAKYFLDQGFAIEGQLNAGGLRLLNGHSGYGAALIEYHLPLPVSSFRLYFGGGIHAGLWSGRDETNVPDEFMFGLSGIGGIEVTFRYFPMSISGDLRPSVNYVQEVDFFPHNLVGVSLRYYFGAKKVKPFQYPLRIRSKFK